MKHTMAGLALITSLSLVALAVPGQALAGAWHCVAHPIGLPDDQHDGFGATRSEAESNALADCEADHGAGTCQVTCPGADD